MSCEKLRDDFALYLYGELSSEAEEGVEQHADGCAACRGELARWRALFGLLDRMEVDAPPELLGECRRDLREAVRRERAANSARPWFSRVWGRFSGFSGMAAAWARPAAAFALLALGFVSARVISAPGWRWQAAAAPEAAASRVRFVEPGDDGQVKLLVEETRQRTVSGRIDDDRIRRLLLAAAQDPADPGLRVETIDLLKAKSGAEDVRRALLAALQHDENAGVRLKAIEGLRPYVSDPGVRRVLAEVLLKDDNPGLRTQAIELLTQSHDREMVGVLQELMGREDNDYIRLRTQRALREMKASVETF
jgi:hypothetical protein